MTKIKLHKIAVNNPKQAPNTSVKRNSDKNPDSLVACRDDGDSLSVQIMPKYAVHEIANSTMTINGAIKLFVNPIPSGKLENKNELILVCSTYKTAPATNKAQVSSNQRCNVE
jgi:hypothetical protein